jgi:hypothetical protein
MKIADVIGRELAPGDVICLQEIKNHDFTVVTIETNRLSVAPGKPPTVKLHLQCNLFMEFPDMGQAGVAIPAYLVVKLEPHKGTA